MGEIRNIRNILDKNERIILKMFFKNRAGTYGLNSFGL
jgi:hypothetical protein